MAARSDRVTRRLLLTSGVITALILVSCSGPDDFSDPAATSTVTTPAVTATTDTSAADVSPTPESTPSIAETSEPSPTAEPEVEPTPTVEPTPEPSPTEEPEPTPTQEPVSAMEALPQLEELSEGAYVVADQGDRTAEQLASAYTDSTAHLQRLESWGFEQHVFREFTHNETDPEDPLPTYVLATVNVYGSAEQADMALQWLEDFQVNQGATTVDPPDVGDAAVALTVSTSQGDPTASVYFRSESRVYIYYAQDNEPLPEVVAVAERVWERLSGGDDVARYGWAN